MCHFFEIQISNYFGKHRFFFENLSPALFSDLTVWRLHNRWNKWTYHIIKPVNPFQSYDVTKKIVENSTENNNNNETYSATKIRIVVSEESPTERKGSRL